MIGQSLGLSLSCGKVTRVVAIIDEACSFLLSFSRAFDTALSVCYTYFTYIQVSFLR